MPGEFRATTDQMLELVAAMAAGEEAKRNARLGSPEFVALAVEVERLSRLSFRWAQMQLQMAQAIAARLADGELDPDIRLIDVKPRPLDVILIHWREAQLRLEIAQPGSEQALAASASIEGLREEYQVAFEERDRTAVAEH
jgi:hypothetical protein